MRTISNIKMKIAVYTPYIDTAGGGEKYMLKIGEILSSKNEVDVLLDGHLASMDIDQLKKKNEERHGLNLSKVNFLPASWIQGNLIQKALHLRNYDWLFYNTDGSIFFSTARNSILHFQMPLKNNQAGNLWQKIKLRSWKGAIYNSKFTQLFIEQQWKIGGEVVYPPVGVNLFKPLTKKKQIISVGRFFGFTKVKKHGVMIEAFRSIFQKGGLKGWSLHLAGGVGEGDEPYVQELKTRAKGFPIYFYPNISLADLSRLYGESAIYWHAMGFEENDPQKMEHFGITTVEAMASGCVPVVINLGGQREIVEDGKSGFLWDNINQLEEKTLKLVKDEKLMGMMAKEARSRSLNFSGEVFREKIESLVYE